MFKVTSDTMTDCIICEIQLLLQSCNAKKKNCALMLIIRNHEGTKCLTNLLQLEPCNVMFKVIWHNGTLVKYK